MSGNAAEDVERREIEMLLPWYVAGTLGCSDHQKVERYLAADPSMAAQLELIRGEREEVVCANEALVLPSDGALDRLMGSILDERSSAVQRARPRLIGDFMGAFKGSGLRWAALTAAVLLIVQAVTIASLLMRERGVYQAASGQAATDGVFALIVFADDAKAQAIAQMLAEFDANIVDGPKPGGVYKIRLRARDGSQLTEEAQLRRLAERRDLVRIVLPSRS
jgi:hypothetical protein